MRFQHKHFTSNFGSDVQRSEVESYLTQLQSMEELLLTTTFCRDLIVPIISLEFC